MESANCNRGVSDAEQSVRSCSMAAECEPVKEEPEWGEGGVSEAAVAEGLYAGHQMKVEIEIGPEIVQKQDIAFSMQSATNKTEEDLFKLEPQDGAGAPSEYTHTLLAGGPRCNMSHKQQHSSEDATFVNTGETSHAHNATKTRFTSESNLTTHTVEKPRPHRSDGDILTVHENAHTVVKPYTCDICMLKFTVKNGLTKHRRTHTGEKPYSCNICSQMFNDKSSLNRHARTHTGEKPHSCEVCNKQFSNKSVLTRHLLTHTGEKPYSCDVCNKCYAGKSELTQHKWIHTDEKPYRCDVCNKRYRYRSVLTAHKRIHTGEKPHSCDICNKRFLAKAALIRHKRIHSGENEKAYGCDISLTQNKKK